MSRGRVLWWSSKAAAAWNFHDGRRAKDRFAAHLSGGVILTHLVLFIFVNRPEHSRQGNVYLQK